MEFNLKLNGVSCVAVAIVVTASAIKTISKTLTKMIDYMDKKNNTEKT